MRVKRESAFFFIKEKKAGDSQEVGGRLMRLDAKVESDRKEGEREKIKGGGYKRALGRSGSGVAAHSQKQKIVKYIFKIRYCELQPLGPTQ